MARRKATAIVPPEYDFENDPDFADVYDTVPAGTIPASPQNRRAPAQYLPQRKGKGPAVTPAGRATDRDFHTCTTDRRGMGGRTTIAKYGIQYLDMCKRSYSPVTLDVMQRRYIRIDKDVEYLNRIGAMSTQSPQKMTREDVANFLKYRQDLGVSNSDIHHDIAALKGVFQIIGSTSLDEALAMYPYLRPSGHDDRLPPMDKRAFDRILENAANVETDDWRRMRAYAVVIFALCSGMRAKELRLCNISDIEMGEKAWTAIVRHPKGEAKYGRQRPVWIDPIGHPFLERYFEARANFVERKDLFTDALFPGSNGDGGYMAGNTLRTDKDIVEEEIGYRFDLRMCRRTYGQRLIDRKVGVNKVSKVLGHNSTATTEKYYCTMDDGDAVNDIIDRIPVEEAL